MRRAPWWTEARKEPVAVFTCTIDCPFVGVKRCFVGNHPCRIHPKTLSIYKTYTINESTTCVPLYIIRKQNCKIWEWGLVRQHRSYRFQSPLADVPSGPALHHRSAPPEFRFNRPSSVAVLSADAVCLSLPSDQAQHLNIWTKRGNRLVKSPVGRAPSGFFLQVNTPEESDAD